MTFTFISGVIKKESVLKDKGHILFYKILFSMLVVLVYMIGRNIPLYGVDVEMYRDVQVDAQSVITQLLSGDMRNCSVFTLGLWPYMMSSMLVMVVVAFWTIDETRKVSPKRMNIWTVAIMMLIACLQSFQKIHTLEYTKQSTSAQLYMTKFIVLLQLIAGMLIVIYISDRAVKYGIGGKSTIYIVNIVDGILSMMSTADEENIAIPAAIATVDVGVMLILETTEKRIAVQRVSIHSIYADKDYIAYKLNPVGVMPLMFASAFFLLPQLIINVLYNYNPKSETIAWWAHNMQLTKPLGIVVYLIIIFLLNMAFAFIILSPRRTAQNLKKTGDSIIDIYAGRPTEKYLVGTVTRLTVVSSIVLCICQGIPLLMQQYGYIDASMAMLPCSVMMCTGMWISFYREAKVYSQMDKYEPFV